MNLQFVQDEDCHWYLIPEGQYDLFEQWIAHYEEEDYEGTDFGNYASDPPEHYLIPEGTLIPNT